MAINTGVNTSKLVGFAVIPDAVIDSVSTSKLIAYAVIGDAIDPSVSTSKLVAYAVFNATNTNPPVWPAVSLPDGYVGVPYSQSGSLAPAATPITYTLATGSLPPGLSLSTVGVDSWKISGTPTTVGTYNFSILATNAYGSANSDSNPYGPLSITITTAPVTGGSASFVFLN